MWQRRDLQVRTLTDLSQWLLTQTDLRAQWGEEWWKAAFEACGSPSGWNEFLKTWENDPRAERLVDEYDVIDDRNQMLPRTRLRRPLDPNQIDLE